MIYLYLLLHLIGFGVLAGVVVITPILERSLRKTDDYREGLRMLDTISKVGLLSPIAVVVMIFSGIGLMNLYGYGPFTSGWLTGKLLIFLVMMINGVYASINIGKRRKEIYKELAEGKENPRLPGELMRAHNRQSQFIRLQGIFLLLILIFTLYKPGL